jgi:enterochelin esterase family protein
MLLTEVLPAVEREYNVAPGRENRAIAGLSMGGLESLSVGLNHPAQFAYVAGMSSALFQEHFEQLLPNAAAKTASLRLLWVGCGTDDHLLAPNRHFIAWAGSKGFTPVVHETPGGHVWLVWRENLEALAPLLFQPQ